VLSTDPGGQRYLRLTPFSAGSSGTSGARGTSGTSGARGTSGTSGTSGANGTSIFTPGYFQTNLITDIGYTLNTNVLVAFQAVQFDSGGIMVTPDTARIPLGEYWELSAHVTTANWTNYSSVAFYDSTNGNYIKTIVSEATATDCPITFTIDMIFREDATTDVQVYFRGTGSGIIVANSFPPCDGDIVDNGATTKTWFYGHRLA
jgi:hypothetical protein